VVGGTGQHIAIENRIGPGRFLVHDGCTVGDGLTFTPLLGIGSLVGINFYFLGSGLVGYLTRNQRIAAMQSAAASPHNLLWFEQRVNHKRFGI